MTTEPVSALPTIRGVSCVLAHTPGLLRYGSKPTRELAKEDKTLLPRMQQHLRSFEDAAAYPPNQVFIGNRTPESLWDVPEPWWRYREANANLRGPFGQIVTNLINNALLHTAANAAGNLAREFALKEITTKIPSYAKGKAAPGKTSPKESAKQ